MKISKKLSKKIMSIALSTVLLTSGSLAASTNVSHAVSVYDPVTQIVTNMLWGTEFYIKLRSKEFPAQKIMAKMYLVAMNDGKVQMAYADNIKCYDYKFDDEYVIGVRDNSAYMETGEIVTKELRLKNDGTNYKVHLRNFAHEFNSLGVEIGDLIYMHGVKWDGTLRFKTDKITQKSKHDYSKGYKNSNKNLINKWDYGFKLTNTGLVESIVVHRSIL